MMWVWRVNSIWREEHPRLDARGQIGVVKGHVEASWKPPLVSLVEANRERVVE
jgi:hypothetical protein